MLFECGAHRGINVVVRRHVSEADAANFGAETRSQWYYFHHLLLAPGRRPAATLACCCFVQYIAAPPLLSLRVQISC
jgi:hypothetical protein